MKILTISNCPLIEAQGSGYVILNYSSGLRRRGHEVDLFGPAAYELFRGFKGRATSYRQELGMFFFILAQMKGRRYDIIEFYGAESWLSIFFLRKIMKTKKILVLHSNGIETHYGEIVKNEKTMAHRKRWFHLDQSRLLRLAFRFADGVVTVSEWDAQFGREEGYGSSYGVTAIENPLPDEYLDQEVDFDRPREIGFCGNWIPRKGIDVVVSDVGRFLREFGNWRFTIVGVGEGFRKEDHFQKDLLSRIDVVPFADRGSELKLLYHRFAVLIMPSVYESFGLVASEAMACGCAVIGTRVGFIASLKDEEEVLLMDDSGSPSLYSKLSELSGDEMKRQRIARGGYKRVQALKWDGAVGRLESIYGSWVTDRQKITN